MWSGWRGEIGGEEKSRILRKKHENEENDKNAESGRQEGEIGPEGKKVKKVAKMAENGVPGSTGLKITFCPPGRFPPKSGKIVENVKNWAPKNS